MLYQAQGETAVVIGLDLTNIYLGRQQAAVRHRERPLDVRLFAQELYRLASDGRPVQRAFALMNELTPAAVRQHFAEFFEPVDVAVSDRTGREIAGDERLQNRLAWTLDLSAKPGVLVLLTGDGAQAAHGIGFGPLVVTARRRGWGVEVFSWRDALNRRLQELASLSGICETLDDGYYAVTFVEGGRRAQGFHVGSRRREVPHRWSAAEGAQIQALAAVWGSHQGHDGQPDSALGAA